MSNIPEADRPYIHDKNYGIPSSVDGVLPWSYVAERMSQSRNYWVATVRPDGRPHVVPVWGVWVENKLYFGGSPQTRWSRNLHHQPEVSVHLEDGTQAIIFEGTVTETWDVPVEIDDAYEAKYNIRHGPPVWKLAPRVVLAWKTFPTDATRWKFE